MRQRARYIGLLVGVAGFLFVARDLITDWDSVIASARAANSRYLAAAFVVAALGMLTIAIGWRQCLLALGGIIPIREALRQYFVGELGKYVPGGVWTVVGRGELARTSGLSRVSSYGATLVSITIAYLAAIGTAGVTALIADVGSEGWWVALMPLLVLVAVAALHPRVIRLGLDLVSKLGRRPSGLELPSWVTGIRLMLLHVPAWVAIGMATWLVALSLDATTPDLANILFAAIVSWVAGLLAVPVPGGIGVREAIFVALATTLSSPGVAAGVAITTRLLFIVVDIGSALVVTFLARMRSSTTTQP
jgi:glycosyltransferase 2 family protein